MDNRIITIDGSSFNDIEGFFCEINKALTGRPAGMLRNLDALQDVLRGGFGVRGYLEPIMLIWRCADKSKAELGYTATVLYYKKRLMNCHPANKERAEELLDLAVRGEGETLFDILLRMMQEQPGIELILE